MSRSRKLFINGSWLRHGRWGLDLKRTRVPYVFWSHDPEVDINYNGPSQYPWVCAYTCYLCTSSQWRCDPLPVPPTRSSDVSLCQITSRRLLPHSINSDLHSYSFVQPNVHMTQEIRMKRTIILSVLYEGNGKEDKLRSYIVGELKTDWRIKSPTSFEFF